MKFRKIILAVILLFLLINNKTVAQAVPPADVLRYLQNNIHVYYLGNPNTATPAFHFISGQRMTANTDGILFGRGGNNAMTQSAVLLLSLFKERTLPRGSGDGRLQDFLYKILNVRNKRIEIVFINDQLHSIDPAFLPQYGFVDTFRVGRNLHVWPTTVMPRSDSLAGTIIIGEKILRTFSNVAQSKLILLNLISSVMIADYRQMHRRWIFTETISTPPPAYPLHYTFSMMDSRNKTSQGIGNGICYAYDTSDRIRAINWYEGKSSLVDWAAPPNDSRGNPTVPTQYWVYSQLQTDNMLSRGINLDVPPFTRAMARTYKRMHFGLNGPGGIISPDIYKYRARDEVMIGLLCDAFVRRRTLTVFLESLKYNNNQFITAPQESRLAVLIENLCRYSLGAITMDQAIASPPENKKHLLAIALFDFLTGFQSGGEVRDMNRYFLSGSLSEELGRAYKNEREAVMSAASRESSNGFLAQVDAITQALGIPL